MVTELECPGYIIDEAQRIIQMEANQTARFVFTNSVKPSLHLIKLVRTVPGWLGSPSASPKI